MAANCDYVDGQQRHKLPCSPRDTTARNHVGKGTHIQQKEPVTKLDRTKRIVLRSLPVMFLVLVTVVVFVVVLVFTGLCAQPVSATQHSEFSHIYRVGILAFRSKDQTSEQWSPLIQYLNESVAEREFRLEALYYEELAEAVRTNDVDFVFTNPAHFIAMGRENDLTGAMATVIMDDRGSPVANFGSVIFRKAPADSTQAPPSLSSLKGATVAAVNRDSLGGYQAAAYELTLAGLDPNTDVNFVFTGMPHDLVAHAVLGDAAEIGFIRTGVLESLIAEDSIQVDQIQVLNLQTRQYFPQLLSTELFPEWPFVALPHVDTETAKRVTAALFSLEPDDPTAVSIGIQGFTIPANYLVVEEAMRSLGLPPFEPSDQVSLEAIWDAYGTALSVVAVLAMILLAVALLQNRDRKLFKRKNAELQRLQSELEHANEALRELSLRDPLTQLYNRRYFDTVFPDRLHAARRTQTSIALASLDIDKFKAINDSLGHPVGDQVLCQVAAVLQKELKRSSDFSVRLGGDEFLIVMSDTGQSGLTVVGERLRTALAAISITDETGQTLIHGVTSSIGAIACIPGPNTTAQKMLHLVDQALYEAKEAGRDRLLIHKID